MRDLIELRIPVVQATAALRRFEWDSEHELRTLTRTDAIRTLERYEQGELTAEDCQRWAEALEGRDDLGLEPDHEDTLKDLLFQLATPEITEPLTPDFAERWKRRLGKQGRTGS